MSNFGLLFKGEMVRLLKYKIIQISFAMTLIWLLVIFLIGSEQAVTFVPIFIFTDAALMTVLLVGASLFYEKQENTLKTLMITPSGLMAIISSKVLSAIYLALQSTIIIALFSMILFDVEIRFFWLISFVVVIAFTHTAIGYTFSVFAKDFNELIAQVGMYMIFFAMPTLFYALGVFSEAFETVLMFSPTHSALLMINYAFKADVRGILLLIGTIYLMVAPIFLFKYIIIPKYPETAVKD